MIISLPAFLSHSLLILGSARAQVSAPTCTNDTFGWVGSLRPDARFVSITTDRAGGLIVVQFTATRSLLDRSMPGGGVQQRWSVHASLAYCVEAYWRVAAFSFPALLPSNSYTGPDGADDGDLCKCNTVFYNLISACDACQGESWIACVDQSFWGLHSGRSTYLSSVTPSGHSTVLQKHSLERKSHVVSTGSGSYAQLPPASRIRSQMTQ